MDTTGPIHVASDCYGPGRNITLDCPINHSVRVYQVTLGISQAQNCPKPATWNVPSHCCSPKCQDCILNYGYYSDVVQRQCDGMQKCDVITQWRRMAHSEVQRCTSQLTNYMSVTYECTRNTANGQSKLTNIPTFTRDIICDGVMYSPSGDSTVGNPNTPSKKVVQATVDPSRTEKPIIHTNSATKTLVTTYALKPKTTRPTNTEKTFIDSTKSKLNNNSTVAVMSPTTAANTTEVSTYLTKATYGTDISDLGNLAKSEALIYGSTAAGALFIVTVGIIVGWLFCRRRFEHKHRQDLERKMSGLSVPIYAFNDPRLPAEPNYYHDYLAENYRDIRMMQNLHVPCPPGYYYNERYGNPYYTYSGPPPSMLYDGYGGQKRGSAKRRCESFNYVSNKDGMYKCDMNKKKNVFTISDGKKKMPVPAKRLYSVDSYGTDITMSDMNPEFKHYVPVSEALEEEEKTSNYTTSER